MTGIRRNSNDITLFSGVDWITVILYLSLTILGFIAIFSATYVEDSENILSFEHKYIKHLFWLGISYTAALIILLLDRSMWHKWAYIICAGTIFIVLMTFIPGLGKTVNGAKAWLGFGGFTLQPMELAKVGISLATARIMSEYGYSVQKFGDVIKVLLLLLIPMGIAVLQNDTGSGLVFCSFLFMFYREGLDNWICVPIIFLAALLILSFLLSPGVLLITLIVIFTFSAGMLMRNRWKACIKYVAALLIISTLLFLALGFGFGFKFDYYDCLLYTTMASMVAVVVYAYRKNIRKLYFLVLLFFISVMCLPTSDMVFRHLKPHQQDRIRTFLGLEDNRDLLYNVNQSKIAIGSGGLTGKGFLEGSQIRYGFVPEKHTDFIFCTIGEEFGFVGAVVLFSLLCMLILRLMKMGDRQLEAFGRVYCYCVASILFFHCFINIGMTMGIVPVMGIPLPFISYGGSSLLGFSLLVFIAIALDASPIKRQSTLRKW
ncbi:MAG: rod shape-determining protein RodA [Alistipes sp.]|nr:rod shape-determining protein RodA [Alistipes sp.]